MSAPKLFIIKETEVEIKKLIKSSTRLVSKRFQALLTFKRHEKEGVSKRQVADEIGVSHNSIQTWRSAYIAGGVKQLKLHGNIGYKPSVINASQAKVLKRIYWRAAMMLIINCQYKLSYVDHLARGL